MIQLMFLLLLISATGYTQIFFRVTQGTATASVANGGSVTVNASGVQQDTEFSVSVVYAGNGTLRFTGAPRLSGSSDFAVAESGPVDTTVPSGQMVVIPLRFRPTSALLTSVQLAWTFTETINQSASQLVRTGAVVLGLNGTAPSVELGYSFATDGNFNPVVTGGGTVPFPVTQINAPTTAALSVLNRGSGRTQVEAISVTGDGFSLINLPVLPARLDAGTAFRFQVRYQPRAEGTQRGSLTVTLTGGQTFQTVLSGDAVLSYLQYEVQSGLDSSVRISPAGTVTMSATPVAQRTAVTFRLTNISPFDLNVPSIAVSGPGFVLADVPFAPFTMAPGSTQIFSLIFAPTEPGVSNGRLRVGSDVFQLQAEAQGSQFRYGYSTAAGSVTLLSRGTITFPDGLLGETSTVVFSITNSGNVPAPLSAVIIPSASSGFSVKGVPALPLSLAPQQAIQFEVVFSRFNAGLTSGVLLINSDSFNLIGSSNALPELPALTVQGPSGVQSFEQPRVSVSLASPFPVALRGILTMGVESDSFVSDPSAQLSTGGRQVAFTIPAGTNRAIFANGLPEVRVQTGSVAGSFLLTPTVSTQNGAPVESNSVVPLRMSMAQSPPRLLSAGVAARTSTTLTLEVIGVTTTRSLSRMTIRMTPRSGYKLAGTEYVQELTGASLLWFNSSSSSSYGGQFVVSIPLQFSSSSSGSAGSDLVQAIESVSIVLTNGRGGSESVTIPVP
jgi:hypothetical protein